MTEVTTNLHVIYVAQPRAGSGVVGIGLLRFLAGCHKGRLNQVPSVLSLRFLAQIFLSVFVLLTKALLCFVLLCVISVFCLLVVLVNKVVSTSASDRLRNDL